MAIWNRDEPQPPPPSQPARSGQDAESAAPVGESTGSQPAAGGIDPIKAARDRLSVATIGATVVVKGTLDGYEDVMIDGFVKGDINLSQNLLTVGKQGTVVGRIHAKTIVVSGKVKGTITATETVRICETATIEADISAPRLAIAEAAQVRGAIDMPTSESVQAARGTQRAPIAKGAAKPGSAATSTAHAPKSPESVQAARGTRPAPDAKGAAKPASAATSTAHAPKRSESAQPASAKPPAPDAKDAAKPDSAAASTTPATNSAESAEPPTGKPPAPHANGAAKPGSAATSTTPAPKP